MPRHCSICDHPERAAIERATVEGVANRRIAAQYAVTERAVRNHKAKHLPAKLSRAHEAKETAQADDLLAQVKQLRGKSVSILLKAEQSGDLKTALMGIREARSCIELLGKLSGELAERQTMTIISSPEWPAVYRAILQNLEPYPAVRAAIASDLLKLEATNGTHRN